MQIQILNDFIKAYENAFCKDFDENFKGRLKSLCAKLNEPFMHLSLNYKKELENLIFSLDKKPLIAIIGQFSSGKSSLLNLILKKDILPTGAVPVTFKPTFLRFGKEYLLRVEFEDGSDELADISELELYTDQRKSLKEAKSLHIFAPIALLEKITLVDTPGLNANETDTITTFNELLNFHAAVWLSLIDNAGKKSEEEAIRANLSLLGEKSICVLNQKDKLDENELKIVLNYAKSVFGKYFQKIIAISCKEARDEKTYEKSNLISLLEFLQKLDTKALKEEFCKRKMLEFCEILDKENEIFDTLFNEIFSKFQNYEKYLQGFFIELSQKIKLLNHQILEKLKDISQKITDKISSFIKEKNAFFYKEAKGIFKKNLFEKFEYKYPFIASDDAFLAMFYNSDLMSKEFKKTRLKLENSFKDLKQDLNAIFEILKNEILLFKAKFSNIQRDNVFQSELNFSELRAFCMASDEYFLKDFEKALFKLNLELDLFFEKLNLKALANYENATKLSLNFFATKMNESRVFYELDSTQFSLFYPKKSEIYERVLNELCVYEFEALLIDKPVITRLVEAFFKENEKLIIQKYELLNSKKSELLKRKSQILEVKKAIKENL